jgi:hypothetical protein
MRTSQSSLEFILNYGFAIIAVIAVIAVLFASGFFNKTLNVRYSDGFDYFQIVDWKVSGRDSEYMNNTFHIVISNKNPSITTINFIKIYDSAENFCGEALLRDYEIGRGLNSETDTGGLIFNNCSSNNLQNYDFILRIGYQTRSGINHTETGRLVFHFEPINDAMRFGTWYHSVYSGDLLLNEPSSKLGSYNSTCPAVSPPLNITFVSGGAPINWTRPTGCASGTCHGVGLSGYCSTNCTNNAHGWLKSSITSPRETRGHKVYLAGNATCNSSFTLSSTGYSCPSDTEHFICVNDDLYFYVNSQLLGYSGLSYYAYKCSSCTMSDYWCVPPVDITQSPSFHWDESNDVYVLVEDWCNGGGIGAMDFMVDHSH